MGPHDRERENVEDELACGDISDAEYNEQMQEIDRDERECMLEEAERAYEACIERW